MEFGVIIQLGDHTEQKLAQLCEMGFHACQLCCWNPDLYTEQMAEKVKIWLNKYGIRISTLWCGWSGPAVWNFYEGQLTLGLVPEQYRAQREQELIQGSDFGALLGVEQIATHVGFLPEDPNSPTYADVVEVLRRIVAHCKRNGQYFLFETGQETPTTLLRTIQDIGLDNLGINLDPANLILYGKANPVDALDTIGKYVRDVHAKDGRYPTDGRMLGNETPLGRGMVNYPALIRRLKSLGYDGPVTIEREISGEKQIEDILMAKALLERLDADE